MSELRVNPNRMELRKIKNKLGTAERGHKLLKNKTNKLITIFYQNVRLNKELRDSISKDLLFTFDKYNKVSSLKTQQEIELCFCMPSKKVVLDCSSKNIINVVIPEITTSTEQIDDMLPYSLIDSTSELDCAVEKMSELIPRLVQLAQVEKATYLLAMEVEKCKQRVNALENILIPKYQRKIAEIELKLGERDRENSTRLMSVKDMVMKK